MRILLFAMTLLSSTSVPAEDLDWQIYVGSYIHHIGGRIVIIESSGAIFEIMKSHPLRHPVKCGRLSPNQVRVLEKKLKPYLREYGEYGFEHDRGGDGDSHGVEITYWNDNGDRRSSEFNIEFNDSPKPEVVKNLWGQIGKSLKSKKLKRCVT